MKLILIRHGMTKGNQEHRYVGSTDEEILPSEKERLRTSIEKYIGNQCLDNRVSKYRKRSCDSDRGYESVDKDDRSLGDSMLKDLCFPNGIYGIYISPLLRCRETAECLFPEMISQGRYEIIDDFREMYFGAFEYKTYQEINEDPNPEYREAYQRYIDSNGETAFPEGESKAEFTKRVVRGFNRIIEDYLFLSKRNSCIQLDDANNREKLRGKKTIKSKTIGNTEVCASSVFCEPEKANLNAKADTMIFVVHGGTIMALLDRYSEPHKDYFEWSLKPGQGYMADVSIIGRNRGALSNIVRIL